MQILRRIFRRYSAPERRKKWRHKEGKTVETGVEGRKAERASGRSGRKRERKSRRKRERKSGKKGTQEQEKKGTQEREKRERKSGRKGNARTGEKGNARAGEKGNTRAEKKGTQEREKRERKSRRKGDTRAGKKGTQEQEKRERKSGRKRRKNKVPAIDSPGPACCPSGFQVTEYRTCPVHTERDLVRTGVKFSFGTAYRAAQEPIPTSSRRRYPALYK